MKHWIVIYENYHGDKLIFTETEDINQAHSDYKLLLGMTKYDNSVKHVALYGVVDHD